MKYSILLAALLSVSALIAAENPQVVNNAELEQNKAELRVAKTEATQAKNETIQAKNETAQAKDEAMKAQKELAIAKEEMAKAKKCIDEANKEKNLNKHETLTISVTGQGVAPMNTSSPAQAYALAKRAAIADAYRAIAEKVQGVRIDGQDLIKDMMVKRSIIRTSVKAMVRNANVVETTFKEGLCEVEMEIIISYSDFVQ